MSAALLITFPSSSFKKVPPRKENILLSLHFFFFFLLLISNEEEEERKKMKKGMKKQIQLRRRNLNSWSSFRCPFPPLLRHPDADNISVCCWRPFSPLVNLLVILLHNLFPLSMFKWGGKESRYVIYIWHIYLILCLLINMSPVVPDLDSYSSSISDWQAEIIKKKKKHFSSSFDQ